MEPVQEEGERGVPSSSQERAEQTFSVAQIWGPDQDRGLGGRFSKQLRAQSGMVMVLTSVSG